MFGEFTKLGKEKDILYVESEFLCPLPDLHPGKVFETGLYTSSARSLYFHTE
jgi:hypothetical protein